MNRHANESAARPLLASVLVCAALCFAALASGEEETRQYDIDIGQLPLAQALETFSQQTGLQYGYLPTDEEEEGLMVGPVQGRFTASEVLAKLLPVGFRFEWVNPRTISIVSPPVNEPPGGVNQAVAEKDQQRSELEKEQKLAMENGGGKSGSARGPYAFDWGITVEASKIFDFDVPMSVLEREDIESLGVSSLGELMNYVPQQAHITASPLGDGAQFADLRGLGIDTTLVLINGRRVTPTASSLTVNGFDLNSLPLGAVESVQIMSDSMSAMHGADAIGGVLNIVLRADIPEPRLDIDYGGAGGGAVERHAAFGVSGSADHARGSIVVDYFDRSPLLGGERDRWSNQNFTRFGGNDWRSLAASPGNVSSIGEENLPGLPSPIAAIPTVRNGEPLTTADFLPTTGRSNLESLYKYQSVVFEGTRKGFAAQGEYSFAPRLVAFGELLYVDRQVSREMEPPVLFGAPVSALNPHNPFGVDVAVNWLLADLGPRSFSRRAEMTRGVAGVRGQVGDWDWEVAVQRMQDDDTSVRSNELDAMAVLTALTTTDRERALNPFGSNSARLLSSLVAAPIRSSFFTAGNQVTVSANGDLGSLPAGSLKIATGGEWREERVRYRIAQAANASRSDMREISAMFGELRFPLVGASAAVPGVKDLSLVLSGRFDKYSDVGSVFSPEYALTWKPTRTVTLRASLSQSFRPPPLFDLYLPTVDQLAPTPDPARGGEVALPAWRAGGNPDLRPSTATSWVAGIEFESPRDPAFRVAANYWRIHVADAIGTPSALRLLAAEDRFADRIIRGEPSDLDRAAGRPGPLQTIDVTRLNFGSIRASGLDISTSLVINTRAGRLLPNLSAAWMNDFVTSDLVNGPNVQRTDVANVQGSVPRWRVVAGVGWDHRGLGASASVRYVPSYDDVDLFGNRNRRQVDSQALVDVQVSANLGAIAGEGPLWRGMEIRVGVQNLLDVEPPFSESAGLIGFDASQGDLRERFGYLKLSKSF
jgi:iron complex outermembrane receptor protein